MIILREFAPAKVNLTLRVTGRRVDGYHLLDSLVGFASITDRLEVKPAGDLTLEVQGADPALLSGADNSVLKAARLLREHANIGTGAAIILHKQLPVAAGIGGGSADAAAALRLLMRFWNIKVTEPALKEIALSLGADVPACLVSASLYMGGIGERIEQGPKLGLHAVLVNPGVPLKTQEVFAAYKGGFSTPPRHPGEFAHHGACFDYLRRGRNDLEEPAISRLPLIAEVIATIAAQKSCALARMSGSGATCFGLFPDAASAQAAAEMLGKRNPSWWVRATVLS